MSAAGESTRAGVIVLYVEDAPANVRLVERILSRNRPAVELVVASDGQEGLEIARERRPELILLDLNLPGMSGEEVLLGLQEEESTRDIPVVMISGDALPGRGQRLREQGAAEFLIKPFQVQHLLDIIDRELGDGRE